MKGCMFAPLLAALALMLAPAEADAGWCGVARYSAAVHRAARCSATPS